MKEKLKTSVLKVGNWPVSNRYLKQSIRYINSMDLEKINHSNKQIWMNTNSRIVWSQWHVVLLTVVEHAEDLTIKKIGNVGITSNLGAIFSLNSGLFAHVHNILSTEVYQCLLFTKAVTLWNTIIIIIMVWQYSLLYSFKKFIIIMYTSIMFC